MVQFFWGLDFGILKIGAMCGYVLHLTHCIWKGNIHQAYNDPQWKTKFLARNNETSKVWKKRRSENINNFFPVKECDFLKLQFDLKRSLAFFLFLSHRKFYRHKINKNFLLNFFGKVSLFFSCFVDLIITSKASFFPKTLNILIHIFFLQNKASNFFLISSCVGLPCKLNKGTRKV